MRKTYSISFPRSGHHWLADILRDYYGDELHYCESYKQPELIMEVCPTTNFQKYHDFKLDFDPRPHQVLVQARRDIGAAMRSWHKFEGATVSLEKFVSGWRENYWLGFMDKWWHPGPDRLLLWYEDLKANPVEQMTRVIHFLSSPTPSHEREIFKDSVEIDRNRLLAAISKQIKWPLLGLKQPEASPSYSI